MDRAHKGNREHRAQSKLFPPPGLQPLWFHSLPSSLELLTACLMWLRRAGFDSALHPILWISAAPVFPMVTQLGLSKRQLRSPGETLLSQEKGFVSTLTTARGWLLAYPVHCGYQMGIPCPQVPLLLLTDPSLRRSQMLCYD